VLVVAMRGSSWKMTGSRSFLQGLARLILELIAAQELNFSIDTVDGNQKSGVHQLIDR